MLDIGEKVFQYEGLIARELRKRSDSANQETLSDAKQEALLSCFELFKKEANTTEKDIYWVIVRSISKSIHKTHSIVNIPHGTKENGKQKQFIKAGNSEDIIAKEASKKTAEENIEERFIKEHKLEDFIDDKLTKKEADVIKKRFLFERKLIRKEISLEINVSQERVRQIENESLLKLKKAIQESKSSIKILDRTQHVK